jgi:hypothetical protein
VAARLHQPLPLVDPAEIEIGDPHAFSRTQGRAEQFALGETIAVKQPPEIGPMLRLVSCMIRAC